MLEVKWVGTDGSEWDLMSGAIALRSDGIQGFGMPTTVDTVRSTALVHGQTLQSWKLAPRPVFLPLIFQDDAKYDVEGLQRSFWRSVEPGKYGTLTVTDGNGANRSLDLRFQDDANLAYSYDPYAPVLGEKGFGINMVADYPFWQGDTVSTSFSLGTEGTATFFGNGSGATDFYIIKSTGGTDATLTNLGDLPTYITWTITAPMTSFMLEVDGHLVSGDIELVDDQVLTIETSPLTQIAYLEDGTRMTRFLTNADFAPLPVGETVNVGIDVVGAGIITASFRPLYMRAF
jgi:hypothetical protein